MLADHVPSDGRILAMDVKDFLRPFANLRQRVDQIDELVAWLPFETEIVGGNFVEHHRPSVGIMRDVPIARRPVAVHGAILKSDFDALVSGATRQFAPDFFEFWQTLFKPPAAQAPGKAGDNLGAEEM